VAIGIAYAQAFWHFIRDRALQIGDLDALFGILYDPSMFLETRLVRRVPLLVVLAVVSWLVPISAILSPAALTGCT
jgi:hypothetical protein